MTESVQVAVVGAGISGLGVALRACQAGYSVALIEQGTLASATSANSLRIIHGGLRYLQHFDLPRVIESVRAQSSLLTDFPDLVVPLPCVMPVKSYGLKSRIPSACAGILYSGFISILSSSKLKAHTVSSSFIDENISCLSGRAKHGALLWHDALLLDPAALAERLLSNAKERGLKYFDHSRVTRVERRGSEFVVVFGQDSKADQLQARVVVNCSGPWVGRGAGINSALGEVQWCRAFNVVIKPQLDPKYALGLESKTGRLFFAVPRGLNTAIGTEYLPFEGKPEDARISPAELENFLAEFSTALPGLKLNSSDVIKVEAGVLPIRRLTQKGPLFYGKSRVISQSGYIEVLSTKYTTFRAQAENVINLVSANL